MKKRTTEDQGILKEASLSESELDGWVLKLFWTEEKRTVVGESIFEWVYSIMKRNYSLAEDEKIRRMILQKILHTKEVVEAGMDIMKGTSGVAWNPCAVGSVCLLHDIGRFPQALLGSYSDIETNFDHADFGALLIDREEFPEMKKLNVQKEVVVEAVRNHSRIEYLGTDIYAKITRDADKLALLRYMPYLIDTNRFPHGEVTIQALDAYKNKTLLENKYMKGYGDVLLSWLCWEEDMNFEATKKAFNEEGVKDWILDEIKKEKIEI